MKLGAIHGVNLGYVVELYERYQRDPDSVDPATRAVFETWRPADAAEPAAPAAANLQTIVGVANLAESIRRYGHMAARLDPLGSTPPGDPSLLAEAHAVGEADLRQLPASLVGGGPVSGCPQGTDRRSGQPAAGELMIQKSRRIPQPRTQN